MTRFVSASVWIVCGLIATSAWAAENDGETDSVDKDYSAELPRIAPTPPDQALSTFEIHPGFRMELVAAEPLVHDPTAMAFDENGRLWVVEMRGYSEQRQENLSAIRVLDDTDSDGVYDKSTIFLDNLEWPTALFCWNGGVFIAVPPQILYCKDTDGDDVADRVEPVFDGFHLSNVQGLLNSFRWGLDNRIHGATSSSGAEVRPADNPGALPVTLRGRDFAFDPASLDFEAESGGGQHGLTYDAWGNKFVCHNSDHFQTIMFEDRYVARNPYFAAPTPKISIASDGPAADVYRISPVEPWRIVRTRLRVKGLVPGPVEGGGTAAGYFTSATGITIYKGNAYSAEYQGNGFVGDVGSNLIHRKTVEYDGVNRAAHRADADTEFIRSNDIWFRPVQFANGPDGCLYVADMYREVIEHPLSLPPVIKKHLDLTSGQDRGRIYRIIPEGFDRATPPRLGDVSTFELVTLLEHDNAWHRETAARLLYEQQDQAAVHHLESLAAGSTSPLGRMHALYALAGLDALTSKTLMRALNDEHPRVREHAVRLTEHVNNELLAERVANLADDGDEGVRYQVAFTLGSLAADEKAGALASLAKAHHGDPWFRVAIQSSIVGVAAPVFESLLADASVRGSDTGRELINTMAYQVGATSKEDELATVIASVDGLPEDQSDLAEGVLRGMIDGLRAGGSSAKAATVLAESERARAILDAMLSRAESVAGDTNAKPEAREEAAAMLALAPYETSKPVLAPLLDAQQPAPVQAAALKSLSRYEGESAAEPIINAWDQMGPAMHSRALEILFGKDEWTAAMLAAMEAGQLSPKVLDSLRAETLRNHENEDIRAKAVALLGQRQGNRQEIVEAYRPALEMNGDVDRGKQLFAENCAQCHKLGGMGYEVGPDLVTMAQAGAEKILQNVLDPNSEVNPQYYNYTVSTTDWLEHSGIIASETATSITLKRPNGDTQTVLRVNIEDITTQNLSLMPEGWEESFDHQAMADLIAYITSVE